jgi:hypothetical protein
MIIGAPLESTRRQGQILALSKALAPYMGTGDLTAMLNRLLAGVELPEKDWRKLVDRLVPRF